MNIHIAGGGRVGFHLARLLCAEGRDVTVIDRDSQRREEVDFALDARTIVGDATSVLLLQSLGTGDADLFVACTGDDRTNMLSATVAKGLGARQVVARVDNPEYVESHFLYEGFLGIDYLLSPDALTAQDIINYIENPGVLATEDFGRGKVQLRQILVDRDAPAVGRTLRDLLPPGSGVLVGVVNRNGVSSIPKGDTTILGGDKVTLLGPKSRVDEVQRLFTNQPEVKKIALLGSGPIGIRIGRALDSRHLEVKLFEKDLRACEESAKEFFRVKVVNRDATSRSALEQEHLKDFDVFVATTEDDERNIMAGVLAREVGVKHVATVVHQPDFAPLVVKLGVDVAVTPRSAFSNAILKIVHQQRVTASAFLGEGDVEVFEICLDEQSPVLGKKILDLARRLPAEALVATILRGDRVIVPGGSELLEHNDVVVMVVATNVSETARRVLQGRNT